MSISQADGRATVSTPATGVWFVGARGSVATTATLGALAVGAGLAPGTGMVSELKEVAVAGLTAVDRLVFGGHDITDETILERATSLAGTGVVPIGLVQALAGQLAAVDSRIRPGARAGTTSQREAADMIEEDVRAFRREHALDRVVVVDVSSTEPPVRPSPALENLAELERALDSGAAPLPQSSLYSYAAFRAGCPVVAFTPSAGPHIGALAELAKEEGLPWAGRDGKTGETLVKSALAPMFATRALQVKSWASVNLLGGGDGRTLADPAAAASKTATKAAGVESILGYPVGGPLHIDYVDDMGDWKTAWDHVSFEGFLGTRMNLQFTWQGCDSALAAPLVLDLVRLVARAHELGESGPLGALAFFFKDPIGGYEHALAPQWTALTRWCHELSELS